MPAEPALPDKVVALHGALSGAGIGHAFGGALALAYYGEPRSTVDVDVNVFVPVHCAPRVAEALAPLGVDVAALRAGALDADGQIRCSWGRTPVDLFFAYDPIHDAMRDRAELVPFGADTIPILAAEHLVVCKAAFDRPKDWIDVEQVLASAERFDVEEVRRWLGHLVGAGERRLTRFDDLARRLRGV